MKAFVIFGDVVDSRRIGNRRVFEKKLGAALLQINAAFSRDFAAPFLVLKGLDEIGAVATSFAHGYEMLRLLWRELSPQKIRIAVCYGAIDIGVESRQVSRMDGPAFHQAAAMLQGLKQTPDYFDFKSGDDASPIVASLVNYLYYEEQKWTQRQREIADLYGEMRRQTAVAKELRITQQAVSQGLISINWYSRERSEKALIDFLKARYA